jgi:hypothetical protein
LSKFLCPRLDAVLVNVVGERFSWFDCFHIVIYIRTLIQFVKFQISL